MNQLQKRIVAGLAIAGLWGGALYGGKMLSDREFVSRDENKVLVSTSITTSLSEWVDLLYTEERDPANRITQVAHVELVRHQFPFVSSSVHTEISDGLGGPFDGHADHIKITGYGDNDVQDRSYWRKYDYEGNEPIFAQADKELARVLELNRKTVYAGTFLRPF